MKWPPDPVQMIDLVDVPAVTRAQAVKNRAQGVHPMSPRRGRRGLVRLPAAEIWRQVRVGAFPPPQRGPEGLCWPLDAIYRWRRHNRPARCR